VTVQAFCHLRLGDPVRMREDHLTSATGREIKGRLRIARFPLPRILPQGAKCGKGNEADTLLLTSKKRTFMHGERAVRA
jgi:hypothetical protein